MDTRGERGELARVSTWAGGHATYWVRMSRRDEMAEEKGRFGFGHGECEVFEMYTWNSEGRPRLHGDPWGPEHIVAWPWQTVQRERRGGPRVRLGGTPTFKADWRNRSAKGPEEDGADIGGARTRSVESRAHAERAGAVDNRVKGC